MTDELLSSAEAFAPSAAATPVIVVKRRRRVEPGGPPAPASPADGGVRQPRVFVLSSPRQPAPGAARAAEEPAPLVPGVGRRPRTRQLQRRPGEVVHILGPATDTAEAGPGDNLGFDLGADDYPKVLAAIEAVQRVLGEAARAAQLQRELQRLS